MKPLVVFDCDGVLTENDSSWRVLHEFFGSRDNSYFAELYEKGVISYLDWMKIDVSLMIHSFGSPIKRKHVEEAFSSIKPKKSAAKVVGELIRNDYHVSVVSSGIGILVSRICRELGIKDCLFNDVLFVNDELVPGGVARVPLKEKWLVIKKFAESKGYSIEHVAYIGDSKWDIPVFKRVGISIAVKPCGVACEHAKFVVDNLEDVLSILNL